MKKHYSIVLIIVFSIIIYPEIQKRIESVDNKIILASTDLFGANILTELKIYFRIVTENDKENNTITLYKSSNNLQLYKLYKDNGGHPSQDYYVFNIDDNSVENLRRIDVLIDSVENGNLSNDKALSKWRYYQIDLNLFNQLYTKASTVNKMKEYAKLYTSGNESFKELKNQNDILEILKFWPKPKHLILDVAIGDSTNIIKDFNFIDSLSRNEFLSWDLKSGVLKYSFGFKKSAIERVEINYMGLIGNERTIQF
ncbi:hypothetical protein [Cyclobacterium amurskyense]|uniref:Uncharacterized protein n=1 Tax=Cyclobacterium amurskyense TaxID=320787 RepID=A0A0H4PA14_9BACT|nr:hypothetical protein [Cyclobacterium amurskyense]AKP51316.1 hypothetical protein CA2015_1886 [Cyclobacterium amurskyense]